MKLAMFVLALVVVTGAFACAPGECLETFDSDPGWEGHNNRLARELPPVTIRNDFGYSPFTRNAGGEPGEIGGRIQPASEPAYYAMPIATRTLGNRLIASGKLQVGRGGSNMLFGFFNNKTINEWRTPNAIVVRINGRGETYEAHVEVATQKWRASAGIIGRYDAVADRNHALQMPCGVSHKWSLEYDPAGSDGKGEVTFTLAGNKAVCGLNGLKADGATFNHFGLLNVIKSYDGAGDLWLDDVSVNGKMMDFGSDPKWKGLRNRATYASTGVRPRFDFGYSPTRYAGGKTPGELGGTIYRGDCRYPERLACYGDRLGDLSLERPLRASGKIVMRRGVSDSTTAFGFYNSTHSMAVSDSQQFGLPRDFLGICVEGPSGHGFYFYPVYRGHGEDPSSGYPQNKPSIYPDGVVHDWTMDYDPAGAQGNGSITVTLDGKSTARDLGPGVKAAGAVFDRFGIVITWVDGNAQELYLDDLEYTSGR